MGAAAGDAATGRRRRQTGGATRSPPLPPAPPDPEGQARAYITSMVSYTSTLPPLPRTGQPFASSAAPARLSAVSTV